MFQSLLDPSILFFILGVIAVWINSDLDFPHPLPRFLSYYLLVAIGMKGGFELSHTELSFEVISPLVAAVTFSFIAPIYLFFILKKQTTVENAGAIAATYGSVSAVTFISAVSFLENNSIMFGGYMVAALALMESPAIISGLVLTFTSGKENAKGKIKHAVKESLTNGSVVLLLGSMLIAFLSKPGTDQTLDIFINALFKGLLCLFLLDMGIVAAKRLKALRSQGKFFIAFALLVPLAHAALAILVTYLLGLSKGDGLLLCVLFASGSYIAVPAAVRAALPKANPGLFVPMSLAITFPFNIIIGIPLYYYLIDLIV
ncbi:MAG: hypothetical protein ACI8QD_000561 [Cyclobacteriaceae bacterium]